MTYRLLFNTLFYLRPIQIFYQLRNRFIKPKFDLITYKNRIKSCKYSDFLPKYKCLEEYSKFTFLNISSPFTSWNDTTNGMLWAYNLNYMDWLLQEDMIYEKGEEWIDKFINELPCNCIGLDPYPIALRGINWIKFISKYEKEIDEERLLRWNDSLYSQYMLLTKKLEYHLLGNHLLEDAYSLYIAAIYFNDDVFYKKSTKLLHQELKEQILSDGAHYEQSPMYHCILLDRLLDCYNFSSNNIRFANQKTFNDFLKEKTVLMLGHLESIIYQDKTIPLLNDSAYGIAPGPTEISGYASDLGISWKAIAMKDCGYKKICNAQMEAIVDIGNITASYQPGHTHADTFNYELRIAGKPFIIDTGISTYNKTERRQYERSTAAHNTVTIKNRNSSETWDGFRVGRRAKVTCLKDAYNIVEALHDGFGKAGVHTRTFQMSENIFTITDKVSSDSLATSYIHLASHVEVKELTEKRVVTNCGVIDIWNAVRIEMIDDKVSIAYNTLQPSKTIKILFTKEMRYSIK